MQNSLQDLEKAVGLKPESGWDNYQRVRAIGEKVLSIQEQAHQMVPLPGLTLTDRVEAIKNRILKKIELFLDLKPAANAGTLARLREIRNMMDKLIHIYDDPGELTAYEQRTVEHLRLALREFYDDLDRVVYFLTYNESYLDENPSPERLAEAIRRLEKEVFGLARLIHPRTAVVKVGEVVNLKEQFPEYEADKKGFVKAMAEQLEHEMMAMLSSIERPAL